MELILCRTELESSTLLQQFETQWGGYVPAIVDYAKSHATKCKDLKLALSEFDDESIIDGAVVVLISCMRWLPFNVLSKSPSPPPCIDVISDFDSLTCLKILNCFLCGKPKKKEKVTPLDIVVPCILIQTTVRK